MSDAAGDLDTALDEIVTGGPAEPVLGPLTNTPAGPTESEDPNPGETVVEPEPPTPGGGGGSSRAEVQTVRRPEGPVLALRDGKESLR